MKTQTVTPNRLISYLERNNIDYTLDSNPSAAKISRLQKAIARKKEMIEDAVKTYKRLFCIE